MTSACPQDHGARAASAAGSAGVEVLAVRPSPVDVLAIAGPPLRHLAVIPDGNRRWAKLRGLPSPAGHRRGCERTLELLDHCRTDTDIEIVTFWTTSIENLHRPPEEVAAGLAVIAAFVEHIAALAQWRIGLLGNLELVPGDIAARLRDCVHRSRAVQGPMVNFAIAYGGQDEITRAVRSLLDAREADGSGPAGRRPVEAADLACHLDTAGQPDPDLVIRTSGETRMSGFMPWQTLHSELYFTPLLWPDFDVSAWEEAIEDYRGRQQRRGL
ncbi:short-chain Z-isoprenyl diphosphate synthase [Streptomyces sp. B1I3]|nr:short-chain Z-isoprenyl diphosphate synthase [Streptomyces sp. B1I3]